MKSFLAILITLGLFLPDLVHSGDLRLCALEDDEPRASRKTGTGIDIEFSKRIADELKLSLSIVWIPSQDKIVEIEDSDLPLTHLTRGACDLVGSVPGIEALGRASRKIELSKPYYGMAFELVGPSTTPQTLRGLGKTKTAVQLQTFAHLILEKLGVPWVTALTPEGAYTMIRSKKADAALIWGPDLSLLNLKPLAGFKPPQALRWNAHFALRKSDPRIPQISASLDYKVVSGRAQKILKKHRVPPHKPFKTISNVSARKNVSRVNLK